MFIDQSGLYKDIIFFKYPTFFVQKRTDHSSKDGPDEASSGLTFYYNIAPGKKYGEVPCGCR